MGRIAILNKEQGRELFHEEIESNGLFYPVLDKDMNIYISEEEITPETIARFPFLAELVLKEKEEVLKELTTEEWLVEDKLEYERRIQEIDIILGEKIK